MGEAPIKGEAGSSRSASLFRQQALTHARTQATTGPILLSSPAPLRWFAVLVAGGFLLFLTFMLSVSLPRIETVQGHLDASKGIITVVSPDRGILVSQNMTPGQSVKEGDTLFEIERPGTGNAVAGAAETARGHLIKQHSLAVKAEARHQNLVRNDLALLDERVEARSQRLALLLEERRLATRRATTMTSRSARIDDLRVQGLVTEGEHEQAMIERQDAEAAALTLDREIAEASAAIKEIKREADRRRAEFEVEVLTRQRERLELESRLNTLRRKEILIARAPVNGLITAVNVKPGQHVAPGAEVVRLLPDDSQLLARFAVSSAAIGFVEPGQPVRLRYDAFPFQKYGDHQGRVASVSATAIRSTEMTEGLASSANDRVDQPFMIEVALEQDHIDVAGKRRPLLPEFGVTGAIVLERRTIMEWLIEPLLAMRSYI